MRTRRQRSAIGCHLPRRVPASQLNQGTPFYGYKYTNVSELFGTCPNAATTADGDCDNTVKTLSYGPQIKDKVNAHGWVSYRDPVALVPYLLRKDGSPGFITYDDPLSTYTRVIYSDWVLNMGGPSCGRSMKITMGTRRICSMPCTRRLSSNRWVM